MSLRGKVLGSYRLLLRACNNLCVDDRAALTTARKKIREEFLKHHDAQGKNEIEELISMAHQAERILRENAVQLVPAGDDLYKLRIREDTVLQDNPIPPSQVRPSPRQQTPPTNTSPKKQAPPTDS